MIKYDLCILVLIFDKEIEASSTINSIINSNVSFDNTLLVIWNNGPKPFCKLDIRELERLGLSIKVVEDISNAPLSKIYNSLFASYSSKKYIILDDDSQVNEKYLLSANRVSEDQVGIPVIYQNDIVVSPKINGVKYKKDLSDINSLEAIGSGIVIGCNIITKILNRFDDVFDERFYFYGVDSTFCIRLKILKLLSSVVIINGFSHSLSRLESESKRMSSFRMKERGCDTGLRIRYYEGKLSGFYKFIKIIAKYILSMMCSNNASYFSISEVIKSYLTGKHYRERD